jgi:thioredoxin-like negative regulator of GroEL
MSRTYITANNVRTSYPSMIQEIVTVEDQDNFVNENDTCIMFFGSHKCQKCNSATSMVDGLARQYPQVKFSHVEVTQTTVENLGQELPVFVCYKGGQPIGKVAGDNTNDVINLIQQNYSNNVQYQQPRQQRVYQQPQQQKIYYNNNNNSTQFPTTMTEISTYDEFNRFISSNPKSIVFFGSQGCPHCRSIKPVIESMVNKYPSVKFAHVEMTENTKSIRPQQFRNMGIPLILSYKNGQLVDNVLGADENGIINMVERL